MTEKSQRFKSNPTWQRRHTELYFICGIWELRLPTHYAGPSQPYAGNLQNGKVEPGHTVILEDS